MKIEAACSNPNDVEFTIVMTATLKEWKDIDRNIDSVSPFTPAGKLSKQIHDLIYDFERAKYMPKTEETDDA